MIDWKALHSLSKRCLAFTPGITKSTQLDVLLYCKNIELLEFIIDHFDTVSDACNCHQVRLVYLEENYNQDNYILSRMFNFDYASGEGWPEDAVTSNDLPEISMLGLHARGKECPRCWNLHDGEDLCSRCESVIND